MEVHQLRYFVAVVQEGGFSRAAESVRVAQPSLSQQIQKLEAEVGQPLFNRFARGVSLTEAGQKLLPFARRILTTLHDAQLSVDESRAQVAGTVILGIIPTVAPYIVRSLLRTVRDTYPAVNVQIREDVTEPLVRVLEQGELDLALVSTCRSALGTQRERWLEEPLLLMLPEDHLAAGRKTASPEMLRGEILLTLEESHCLSQQLEGWCRRHKIPLKIGQPAVQLSTIVAMVASGQGVSLLPAMAVPYERDKGCVFLSLRGAAPRREINLLRNPARFRSRAAMIVATLARQVVAEAVAAPRGNEPTVL